MLTNDPGLRSRVQDRYESASRPSGIAFGRWSSRRLRALGAVVAVCVGATLSLLPSLAFGEFARLTGSVWTGSSEYVRAGGLPTMILNPGGITGLDSAVWSGETTLSAGATCVIGDGKAIPAGSYALPNVMLTGVDTTCAVFLHEFDLMVQGNGVQEREYWDNGDAMGPSLSLTNPTRALSLGGDDTTTYMSEMAGDYGPAPGAAPVAVAIPVPEYASLVTRKKGTGMRIVGFSVVMYSKETSVAPVTREVIMRYRKTCAYAVEGSRCQSETATAMSGSSAAIGNNTVLSCWGGGASTFEQPVTVTYRGEHRSGWSLDPEDVDRVWRAAQSTLTTNLAGDAPLDGDPVVPSDPEFGGDLADVWSNWRSIDGMVKSFVDVLLFPWRAAAALKDGY